MNDTLLELSQMINRHPVKNEKSSYKVKYINMLEYFVKKYSQDDIWANAVLKLYITKLLDSTADYVYNDTNFDIKRCSKKVLATKFRPFKFFTYRYCLIFDCIFMNAYNDEEKGKKIFNELSELYHRRYKKNMERVFQFLYDPAVSVEGIKNIKYLAECWNKNRIFLSNKPLKIIITATMSAGKSTLLNALVGKKVNKTQNEACTAKIHCIVNKAFEDQLCYEWDYALNLDADYATLMEDNSENESEKIIVGTYFRSIESNPARTWFIDTPGVNSFQNKCHKEITEHVVKEMHADWLVYLLNGENIGTDDDRRHLLFILENYKGNLIFVVNKVDRFRKNEDSVEETLAAVKKDLSEIGFENPFVVPISAYAAYLAKRYMLDHDLDEDEQDEFERLERKLSKEGYQFDTYYPRNVQEKTSFLLEKKDCQLLMHSGILQLESIIYNK